MRLASGVKTMGDLILKMNRLVSDDDTTIGIIKSEKLTGFTCEDEFRLDKLAGETRIPQGVYEIKYRKEGGMIQSYQQRYSNHPGMLHLQNVEGFQYVYIHTGNTDDHTEGCILVGYGANLDGELCISNSRNFYIHLYREIQEAFAKGRKVHIAITDNDMPLND